MSIISKYIQIARTIKEMYITLITNIYFSLTIQIIYLSSLMGEYILKTALLAIWV